MATTSPRRPRAGLIKRWRYKYLPDYLIGEILTKQWVDTAIPVLWLVAVLIIFGILSPGFYKSANLESLSRVLGEYLLMAIGQTLVVIGGGIDLSVGSIFGLCNFFALALIFYFKLHPLVALPVTILFAAAIGSINGALVGYLRLRAFLTTLVMLIILRAAVDFFVFNYAGYVGVNSKISGANIWDFFAAGSLFGLPWSFLIAIIIAICAHIVLSRMRLGWQMMSIGGSRRSAYNAGIRVRYIVFLTYVISGALTGFAAYFYAARMCAAGTTAGLGAELIILTGVVVGGISLGGGRGTIAKAVIGTAIVVCISIGMLHLGLKSGGTSMVLGTILLFAVVFDIRWNRNKTKVLNRTYVCPIIVEQEPAAIIEAGSDSPYARVDRFFGVKAIGAGVLDGAEDMVLDDEDNLFCGCRKGDVYRFFAPDYKRYEIFAHTGGYPLGMQIDRDGSIVVCVSGMGLFRLTKQKEVIPLCVETNRSFSILDDSRVRMADDCDIAPDGKVYFSDPTVRYSLAEWLTDALEGRGAGRLICCDTSKNISRTVVKNLVFSNGVCVTHDGQAVLIAETWASRIKRYWIDGPKKGQVEVLMTMPGYPDNINRASGGNYWCAIIGLRAPAFDLALELPDFRKRMIRQVAPDNWLFPNTNTGCVFKFDGNGRVLETLWDPPGGSHPQITSIREHKGKLYLGGIHNDRIGVFDLPDADPEWTGFKSYWG